jgi:hypothetical protein
MMCFHPLQVIHEPCSMAGEASSLAPLDDLKARLRDDVPRMRELDTRLKGELKIKLDFLAAKKKALEAAQAGDGDEEAQAAALQGAPDEVRSHWHLPQAPKQYETHGSVFVCLPSGGAGGVLRLAAGAVRGPAGGGWPGRGHGADPADD